jgi:hypothetical protein
MQMLYLVDRLASGRLQLPAGQCRVLEVSSRTSGGTHHYKFTRCFCTILITDPRPNFIPGAATQRGRKV